MVKFLERVNVEVEIDPLSPATEAPMCPLKKAASRFDEAAELLKASGYRCELSRSLMKEVEKPYSVIVFDGDDLPGEAPFIDVLAHVYGTDPVDAAFQAIYIADAICANRVRKSGGAHVSA